MSKSLNQNKKYKSKISLTLFRYIAGNMSQNLVYMTIFTFFDL